MNWYSPKDAAPLLGLAIASVRRLLASGELGCRRIGPRRGRIQISDAHISDYLARAEVEGYSPRVPLPAKAAATKTSIRTGKYRLLGL